MGVAQRQAAQGDLLFVRRDIPAAAKEASPQSHRGEKCFVLAEGEATGHAHVVCAEKAAVFTEADKLFMRSLAPVPVKHEEHAPGVIGPGDWEVVRQREYAGQNVERRVAD